MTSDKPVAALISKLNREIHRAGLYGILISSTLLFSRIYTPFDGK
jgi:hypothetical protein